MARFAIPSSKEWQPSKGYLHPIAVPPGGNEEQRLGQSYRTIAANLTADGVDTNFVNMGLGP